MNISEPVLDSSAIAAMAAVPPSHDLKDQRTLKGFKVPLCYVGDTYC